MKTKHTEDCLDANDDTSVLKGKCICPKVSKHTPTPWRKHIDGEKIYASIRGANNETIADCGSRSDLTGQANAEFIVRAVNSHEALLEACKVALEYLNSDSAGPELDAQLSRAIALAEGESNV